MSIDFRKKEAKKVFHLISSGESCSIIGVSSTGKSNFIKFLCQLYVKEKYLGNSSNRYLFVLLDSNFLSVNGITEWQVYELALHRLLRQATPLLEDKIVKRFHEHHRNVVADKDAFLALRYLEEFLDELCNGLKLYVVFLFDEFDEIIRDFDRRFFLNLRAIRDEFKYKVMYVLASRDELSRIRRNLTEIEAFYELVSLNVIGLKPYNEVDALSTIDRFANRQKVKINDMEAKMLVKATGGHPGILKAVLWLFKDNEINITLDLDGQLLSNAGVRFECLKIWNSLGEDERQELTGFFTGTSTRITSDIANLLEVKGLIIKQEDGSTIIFCNLFKDFTNYRRDLDSRGIKINKEKYKVQVEGKDADLTRTEFKLFYYLYENKGRFCTRDELIEYLYTEEGGVDAEINNNTIDSYVSRIRKKIESDGNEEKSARQWRYIETKRNFGYRFVE